MIRHARQIASVCMIEAVLRLGVEALLAHHLLGVHAPALDELGGVAQQARQRRMARAPRVSWRWWPGYASWMLVLLIEP